MAGACISDVVRYASQTDSPIWLYRNPHPFFPPFLVKILNTYYQLPVFYSSLCQQVCRFHWFRVTSWFYCRCYAVYWGFFEVSSPSLVKNFQIPAQEQSHLCCSPRSVYTMLIYTVLTDSHPYKPGRSSKDHYNELIWVADTECWSSSTCISSGVCTICIHDAAGMLKDDVVWTRSSFWLGVSTILFSFHYLKEADLVAI